MIVIHIFDLGKVTESTAVLMNQVGKACNYILNHFDYIDDHNYFVIH